MPKPLTQDQIRQHVAVLNDSRDQDTLTASAVTLAASQDRDALIALGRLLRSEEFLGRLDHDGGLDHLITVFRALAEHPTFAGGRLCELLYREPLFRSLPARLNPLLAALAAFRPTTAEAAAIFLEASREGFEQVIAPLLLRNESPAALQVFEELIAADWIESYVKVDILHRSVLPVRTSMPVLGVCAHLLGWDLPADVRYGLIETLFDYKSRLWFGPAMQPPTPPPWESASPEALQFLIALGERVLPGEGPLRTAILNTLEQLRAIQKARLQ